MRHESTWVKTDIDYGLRWARFCVPARMLAQRTGMDLRGISEKDTPEEIENWFMDMIEEFRPDLTGCTLIQIKYDVFRGFEFTLFHRSLKPMADGMMAPLLYLFPEPGLIENTDLVPIEKPES